MLYWTPDNPRNEDINKINKDMCLDLLKTAMRYFITGRCIKDGSQISCEK